MNILILILGLAFAATERQVTVTTLKVKETGGTNEISIRAPGSFTDNYVFTLPSTVGTTGQALITNGTGSFSYADVATLTGFGTLSNKVLLSPLISGGTLDAALATNINIGSGTASLNKIRTTHVEFTSQVTSPFTPGAGTLSLYVKSDNKAYLTTDAGLDISLGSSGGEATNLLTNASFDSGSIGHSLPAGTMAVSLTDLIDGTQALFFSASSTAGTIVSQILQPTGSFGGVNLESALFVKTTVGSLEVCSMQGFSAVQCTDVPTAGAWTNVIANMAGPSSGSFGYALRTKNNVAVSGTVGIDAAYVGRARNLAEVSQAQFVGSVNHPSAPNCVWDSSSTSPANYSADADCTTPIGTNIEGQALAPAVKIPGIRFASLGPGRYVFKATGNFTKAGTTSSTRACWRFSDGVTSGGSQCATSSATTTIVGIGEIYGEIVYTTPQTNPTIQIQAFSDGAAESAQININSNVSTVSGLKISVYRYPTQNEIIARADQVAWYVDANLDGANPDMGTTAISSYTEITDSSLTLKPISGSAPVGVTCSSTNSAAAPSTGNTTCSAGSESIGINFAIPKGGTYQVCSYFTHYADVTAISTMSVNFQLIETPTNAQTLTLEGGTRLNSFHGGLGISGKSQTNCSLFNWQSQGVKAVRLMREQSASGTVNNNLLLADAGSLQGQRDIRFTVFPITNAINTPLYVGSVTSTSSGLSRNEAAQFNGGAYSTACSSSPCTVNQNGNWISQITRASTGSYTVFFQPGTFSSTPFCTVNATTANRTFATTLNATSGSIGINSENPTPTATDIAGVIECFGAR